jgi:hypothetical protein
MNKETFKKAIKLHKELIDLEAIKNGRYELEYTMCYGTMCLQAGAGNARFREILKPHEEQIKKEVDDAIEDVKQQTAEL